MPFSDKNIWPRPLLLCQALDLHCLRRLFASGQLVSLHVQIMASNLDLCDCGNINTAEQQSPNGGPCVSALEASYLCTQDGTTPEPSPGKSQMGTCDWGVNGMVTLSFSDVRHDQLEHLLLHESHDRPVCEYSWRWRGQVSVH